MKDSILGLIIFGVIGACIGGPVGAIIGFFLGIFGIIGSRKEAKINDTKSDSFKPLITDKKTKKELLEDADYAFTLGLKYHKGTEVKQDYQKAVQWYRKAADQGHAHAQYNLGSMYYSGKGVCQDYSKAVRWLRKAAEQGSKDAQYLLAGMFQQGKGVAEDYRSADHWYRKAVEQGHIYAQYKRTLLQSENDQVIKRLKNDNNLNKCSEELTEKASIKQILDPLESDSGKCHKEQDLGVPEYLKDANANIVYQDGDFNSLIGVKHQTGTSKNDYDIAIKKHVEQINIPYLVHFTNLLNLKSILRHGILPKDDFNNISTNIITNDQHRWDNCTDAVSLSISFPNSLMFYKYRQQNFFDKWVVLLIKPKLLWEQDCAFCAHNAADKRMRHLPINKRKGISAFKKLFFEIDGCESRLENKLESHLTTDVQAEVLLFGRVAISDIIEVAFDDEISRRAFKSTYPHINSRIYNPNKGLFGTRDYYMTTKTF
jgi:hypothetical protein